MDSSLKKKKIRKYRDLITAAGYGIVIFVIWDLIKSAIFLKWNLPDNPEAFSQPIVIIYIVFALVEFILCVISGFILIKFGRSNKNVNSGLLIISIIILLIAIYCLAISILSLFDPRTYSIVNFITLIEDILFLIFSIQIVYSLYKIAKLSKVLTEHNHGV